MQRGRTVLAMDCVLAGAETLRGRPLNSVVRHHGMGMASAQTDLGFSYRATALGSVRISRADREVVTLRAKAAAQFLAKAEGASPDAIQQLCARATGNYKRGNESVALAVRSAKGRDV